MSAALLDHLWQSTVFAGGAWITTLLLRRHHARLRHAVWLAASIKFLIPFSWLALLGAQLQPFVSAETTSALATLVSAEGSVMLATPSRVIAVASPAASGLVVISALWLFGTLALATRWFLRWRQVRRIVRAATLSGIPSFLPVMTSPGLREPAVVGIFRPVLLLPAGIEDELTTEQLGGVFEHELCHVRRHDNLTASLHMLVEALFWFHPLVWWIGARLIEERERACDEAVVRAGSDARSYAESILTVCRAYAASDLVCVSGISGADLKKRMEGIMKTHDVFELSTIKRLALGMLAVAAIAAPVCIGLASPARAETPAAAQAANPVGKITLLPGKRVKLSYKNVPVRELLRAMGEAAQVNVLVNTKISSNVTLDLAEMSWDDALNVILNANGLVKSEKNGILFIDTAGV